MLPSRQTFVPTDLVPISAAALGLSEDQEWDGPEFVQMTALFCDHAEPQGLMCEIDADRLESDFLSGPDHADDPAAAKRQEADPSAVRRPVREPIVALGKAQPRDRAPVDIVDPDLAVLVLRGSDRDLGAVRRQFRAKQAPLRLADHVKGRFA